MMRIPLQWLAAWTVFTLLVGFLFGMFYAAESFGTERLTPGAEQIVAGSVPKDNYTNYYVVREGDTLSHIASKKLGSAKRWPDLVEWNDLEVHWKDGIAIVWLSIGQEILLAPKELHLDPQAIYDYSMRTKIIVEKEIFRMARIRDPYPRWSEYDVDITIVVRSQAQTRHTILRLEEWTKLLKQQERYLMADSLYDWALANGSLNKFFPNDNYWVQHRKVILLLLALLDVESNAMFVRGSHGELGPWQIKAKTFDYHRPGPLYARLDGKTTEEALMTDFDAGMHCAMEILGEKDEKRQALAHYNRGSKRWIYAQKVINSYRKMLSKAQRLDDEA